MILARFIVLFLLKQSSAYYLKSSGYTCDYYGNEISTAADCETAAGSLGLIYIRAFYGGSTYPEGCFRFGSSGSNVYFNTFSQSSADCSSSFNCVCKSDYFKLDSGDCSVDASGYCIKSPNYPSNYGSSQSCVFSVMRSTALDVIDFELEDQPSAVSWYDYLTVEGTNYAGTSGPNGVIASEGNNITFHSDSSVELKGFYICTVATFSPIHEPTHMPTHKPTHKPTQEPTHIPSHVPTQNPIRRPSSSAASDHVNVVFMTIYVVMVLGGIVGSLVFLVAVVLFVRFQLNKTADDDKSKEGNEELELAGDVDESFDDASPVALPPRLMGKDSFNARAGNGGLQHFRTEEELNIVEDNSTFLPPQLTKQSSEVQEEESKDDLVEEQDMIVEAQEESKDDLVEEQDMIVEAQEESKDDVEEQDMIVEAQEESKDGVEEQDMIVEAQEESKDGVEEQDMAAEVELDFADGISNVSSQPKQSSSNMDGSESSSTRYLRSASSSSLKVKNYVKSTTSAAAKVATAMAKKALEAEDMEDGKWVIELDCHDIPPLPLPIIVSDDTKDSTIVPFPSVKTTSPIWDDRYGPAQELIKIKHEDRQLNLKFEKGIANYPIISFKKAKQVKVVDAATKKTFIKEDTMDHPKVGDHVLKVGGTELLGMTYEEAIQLINSSNQRPLYLEIAAALPSRDAHSDDTTFNIVSANTNSGMTVHQLVLVTWKQIDTEQPTAFRTDKKSIGPSMFDYIVSKSKDRKDPNNPEITVEDVSEAMEDEFLQEYVKEIGSVKLNKLLRMMKEKPPDEDEEDGDESSPRAIRASSSDVAKKYVKSTTSAAARAARAMSKKALKKKKKFPKDLNPDGSGFVSKKEWMAFIDLIQHDSMEYLRKDALLKGYLFMGLGLEPGEPFNKSCTKLFETVAEIKVPRGYWEDLYDYAMNNHPLLVMFYCDESHPYGKRERFFEFIGMASTAFFSTGFDVFLCDEVAGFFLAPIVVNIPQYFFRTVTFYCFTNVCLMKDRSTMTPFQKWFTSWVSSTGICLGILFTLLYSAIMVVNGALFIQLGVGCEGKGVGDIVLTFLYNLGSYLITWFFGILLIEFNPHPESCRNTKVNKYLGKLGIKPGRWYQEREMLQGTILKSIRTRGKLSYFLCEAAINFRRESLAGEAGVYTREVISPTEIGEISEQGRQSSSFVSDFLNVSTGGVSGKVSNGPVKPGDGILHVKVPKKTKPGSIITVTLASGEKLSIKVPKGAKPGHTIKVRVPTHPAVVGKPPVTGKMGSTWMGKSNHGTTI